MAKKIKKDTNSKKNKKKSQKNDENSNIKIKKIIPNEILWIFKIFIMIFIALSLFSHSYLDSSLNRVSEEPLLNYFGIAGSYFSDIIFQIFGVVSYVIPIFFPIYYIKKQFFKNKEIFLIFNIEVILTITIISSLITIFPIHQYEGGILGSVIAINLIPILNLIGTTLLLSFILFSTLILMFEIPIKKLMTALFIFIMKSFIKTFKLLKNHLKELKEKNYIDSNILDKDIKKDIPKKKEKSQKKKEEEKEKIIEEYDIIKMEKLKIKEEIRLEKERIKLERFKQKQAYKQEKKSSKEEEKIIDEIFSESIEKSSSSNPKNKNKPKNTKPEDKEEFFTDESKEKKESKEFVMYSKIKNINDDDIIDNTFNIHIPPKIEVEPNLDEEKTIPANENTVKESIPYTKEKIKFQNFESSLKKEINENEIEIKVAKKTNTNDFENFENKNKTPKETNYNLPPLEYLRFEESKEDIDQNYLMENAKLIIECLEDFGINDVKVKEIFQGPTLTTYEIEIKRGIQISKVIKYTDEIAAMLKVSGVRMISIPQKGVIGVEVPNKKREIVWLKEIIASPEYQKAAKKSKLTVVLGKDISGEPIIANLAKMPHLLIAGTTGSGKSVFNNVLITSILYNATPDEVKFILIDPKMLEFSLYNDIPNLLFPVIIDPKKAAHALNWAVDEMERRYKLIADNSERDIISYNNKMKKMKEEGPSKDILNEIQELETLRKEIENDESISQDERDRESKQVTFKIAQIKVKYSNPEILPYIVVVLDEYADLMMVAGKNVEISISRIAQKARAAGIHLVIATQRPDKDVVTGIIKANLPVRVALSVKGSTNSKIILDSTGAEKLLGHGDLLYLGPGTSSINRIQSPLVTSDEQKKVLDFLKEQGKPTYTLELLNQYDEGDDDITEISDDDKDIKYDEAVKIAIEMKKISASYLQRRLKLGYNRAARIVEVMEKEGIVGPPNGSKPRKVMISEYTGTGF